MNARFLALVLACASFLAGLAFPAAAQGLRVTPQLGARPAPNANAGPQPADYIVAVENSEPITNNEVRRRTVRYEQQLAAQGSPMPPRAQLTREVLDRLITEKAQLQVARESGVRAGVARSRRRRSGARPFAPPGPPRHRRRARPIRVPPAAAPSR